MKPNSQRTSSILLSLLFLVAALIGYFDFVVPSYSTLEEAKGQLLGEQALLANEQQLATQIQGLLTTYQEDASSTQTINLALPVGQDISGALAQIYGIANSNNVGVMNVSVSVQAAAPLSQTGGDTTLQGAAANGAISPMGTVSLQVTGNASYESFKQFLKGLENNIRIFDVTGISLVPSPLVQVSGKTTSVNQDLFQYAISVNTYYESSEQSTQATQ